MKYILIAIVVGVLGLIANNGYKNVKAQEYRSCMVTSTDKTICDSLRD